MILRKVLKYLFTMIPEGIHGRLSVMDRVMRFLNKIYFPQYICLPSNSPMLSWGRCWTFRAFMQNRALCSFFLFFYFLLYFFNQELSSCNNIALSNLGYFLDLMKIHHTTEYQINSNQNFFFPEQYDDTFSLLSRL